MSYQGNKIKYVEIEDKKKKGYIQLQYYSDDGLPEGKWMKYSKFNKGSKYTYVIYLQGKIISSKTLCYKVFFSPDSERNQLKKEVEGGEIIEWKLI